MPVDVRPDGYDSVENKVTQLLLAFAQGAGSLLLSLEAIAHIRAIYEPKIRQSEGEWESVLPAAAFYARTLGAAASVRAASEGHQFIEPSHFVEAGLRAAPLARIDCPFC